MRKASYECRRIYKRDWRRAKRKSAIDKLGGKCARCGFSDIRALCLDHIRGCLKPRESTNAMAKTILRGSKRFQVLCANCNMIKVVENNEWAYYDSHPQSCPCLARDSVETDLDRETSQDYVE